MKHFKNIINVAALVLVGYLGQAQEPASNIKVDAVKYKTVTTTERNAFTVPSGEHWRIYNSDLGRFEEWSGTQWVASDNSLKSYDVTLDSDRRIKVGTSTVFPSFYISDTYNHNFFGIKPDAGIGTGLVSISEDAVFEDEDQNNEIKIAFNFNSANDKELVFDANGISYNGVQLGAPGTDSQTAAEVSFSPAGNTASDNVQAAIEELQVELDGVVQNTSSNPNAAEIGVDVAGFDGNLSSSDNTMQKVAQKVDDLVLSSSGGLTADQENRLMNENKFKYVTKSADFEFSNEDVEVSSGIDIGKKSIIDCTSDVEGVLQDNDMEIGESLIIQGNANSVTTYFAQNESGLFQDGNGNSGNQIVVAAGEECIVLKKSDTYYRLSGAYELETKTFGPNLGPELIGDVTMDDVGSWWHNIPDQSADGFGGGVYSFNTTGAISYIQRNPLTGFNEGALYRLTYDIISSDAGGLIIEGGTVDGSNVIPSVAGNRSVNVLANSNAPQFVIKRNSSVNGGVVDIIIDNVSLKEILP